MLDKVIKTNHDEYDQIISLGGNCNVAYQLMHRGKRVCAFPLDWTFMDDDRPIRKLPELIATRFKNFCRLEHLRELPEKLYDRMGTRCNILDEESGFRLVHHFMPPFAENYDNANRVMRRRIDRFYAEVSKAKRVLFVLATKFTFDQALVGDIYEALHNRFADTEIEVLCIQFGADGNSTTDLRGGQVHVVRFERQMNFIYDNQLTAPEWCFMDRLQLTGRPPVDKMRRKNLGLKLAYKLWKYLGKYLELHGTGCMNVRFANWQSF